MGIIIERKLKKKVKELEARVKEMHYINMQIYKKAYDNGYRKAKNKYKMPNV